MRQRNVCLTRVFKVYAVKFVSRGLMQAFVLAKKCAMKIEKKKDDKMMGASYKVTREMRAR